MKPLLSIIIPTHNRSKLLMRCLNTIKSKSNDYEIIIVDDGSNYNVEKYFSIYQKKNKC